MIFIGEVLEAGGHYGFTFFVAKKLFSCFLSDASRNRNFPKRLKTKNMFSLKMITFCKNANCPASEDLLAFQTGRFSGGEREEVCRHLEECEFCAAEVEFYVHYPPAESSVARVEIPLPLYELAKALLGNKHKEFSLLNRLLCENEGVKI